MPVEVKELLIKQNNNNSSTSFDTEVYDQITRFLRDVYRKSENTGQAYERDIRNFFRETRKKDIEHLKKKNLIYTHDEFEDYYSYLLDDRGVSVLTANRYITSVSECIKYLHSKNLVSDISFLNIRKDSQESERYGTLSIEEVVQMSELAKKHGHKDSGEMKRLLILFTVDVRARLNEVLNVTWHDFQINEHDVHVYMVGKGRKKIRQTISKTLYEQLLGIRIDGEDRVFNIHRNTVNRLMNYLREKMNFPPQRKIVFHSFKKAGVDFVYNNTKDILLTSIAANHSDVGVTDRYINKEKDIGIVGVFSSQNGIDKKLYKKITHEDLLKAIDALPLDQQMYINLKIREISN